MLRHRPLKSAGKVKLGDMLPAYTIQLTQPNIAYCFTGKHQACCRGNFTNKDHASTGTENEIL